MGRLLKNDFMNTYVVDQTEQERVAYLDKKFGSHQPIFKHYIKNNTCLLKKDLECARNNTLYKSTIRESDL
jgi:ABC-type dipeptide/oligopeptide/nickel transport system permease component